ncbi:HAD-IC family P-type ATPase [Rathayibacter sp. YIM 133350]|uniref:HAD-IC family P-type ATPase n=1 Tax=Rathayibacter sp. YIM 133350 TaxID=3131992 RepID=UPI00307D21C6
MIETVIGEQGLTSAEVADRTRRGLVNAIDDSSSRSIWSIVRANVLTLFNGIVLVAFGLLLVLGRWQDALFGLTAIANAVIGVTQEYRAKRALDQLALLHAPKARVERDGVEQLIAVREVVMGDLLVLVAGDQVTADGVVLSSRRLEIDESLLTGEADPVDKSPGTEVLSGSIVVGGEGRARVTRVGADSFANRLTSEARRFSLVSSELRTSVNRILRWITWAIFPIMLLVVNSQMQVHGGWQAAIESGEWREAAVGAIAAVIAMIPLGLVLLTSIAFAVGAVKLARRQVLVQELPAVEGLARVDVICLDKTGTLTDGEIMFDRVHSVTDEPQQGWEAVLAWSGNDPRANSTARCLTSAFSDAHPVDPVHQIEFSSARKWSAVAFATDSGRAGTWVLGAPEMVLRKAENPEILSTARDLASTGRRTLVLAHASETLSDGDVAEAVLPGALRPVVLLTFRENLRPDAAQTLAYFAKQGVGIRIISGDNPLTVAAVARDAGVEVGAGYDARRLPTDIEQMADVLETEHVLGRVTPGQKKGIVEALQRRGHVVAMTGDGVNDALAIKTADMGIAMESGSAATKAVSRIVLLDGKFSHLPGVVDEGRQVIANIERVSMLFLTKTAYAITLSVLFGVLLWGFPFLPRQLSMTDGLTIGIPAFFLALMPNARRYLPGFLRRSLSFAIPAGLIVALALVVINGFARSLDTDPAEYRTASTIALAVIGLWVLMVLSRPFTIWKALIVAAMYVGLVLAFVIPLTRDFFVLVLPQPQLLTVTLVTAVIGSVLVEVLRFIQVRWMRRAGLAE